MQKNTWHLLVLGLMFSVTSVSAVLFEDCGKVALVDDKSMFSQLECLVDNMEQQKNTEVNMNTEYTYGMQAVKEDSLARFVVGAENYQLIFKSLAKSVSLSETTVAAYEKLGWTEEQIEEARVAGQRYAERDGMLDLGEALVCEFTEDERENVVFELRNNSDVALGEIMECGFEDYVFEEKLESGEAEVVQEIAPEMEDVAPVLAEVISEKKKVELPKTGGNVFTLIYEWLGSFF